MTTPCIAIIDDDMTFLNNMDKLLSRSGYLTIPWISGEGALDMLRKTRPTAVILDLNLGEISGADILDALHNDPLTHDIPVVLCSGELVIHRPDARTLQQQAHCVLHKPFDGSVVLNVLKLVLQAEALK